MKFDNLTEIEKQSIFIWTNNTHEYRMIKKILRGEYVDDFLEEYRKNADSLMGLFCKYSDNTDKAQPLFRGDIIEEPTNTTEKEKIDVFLQNHQVNSIITLEKSILSFSNDLSIAKESIQNSSKNNNKDRASVIYQISSRFSTCLDVSQYSKFPNENEILIQPELKFKIVNIFLHDSKTIYCEIEEIAI